MYNVIILKRAQKELAELPADAFQKLRDSMSELIHNPRPYGCRKLTGREGWRIRIGNYRVIYEIDDQQKTILILHVGHRRDVYH
ncbi:MAG: type II toxin-antitoxin system RelE/ParE family toxin [Bacteroidota bacterium]